MNLQSKIDYSISLLSKSEPIALDYDSENGFYQYYADEVLQQKIDFNV